MQELIELLPVAPRAVVVVVVKRASPRVADNRVSPAWQLDAMPRHFSSDVVKIEDGVEQDYKVKMNEPLRYNGFMFSQKKVWKASSAPAAFLFFSAMASAP